MNLLWTLAAVGLLAGGGWAWHLVQVRRLNRAIEDARKLARESDAQRNSVQEELFRRLYEQRELDRQKVQFQNQLAEYEKFAALAQLALGAAHEINNPLLGILSHLELELRSSNDSVDRSEIEQCIVGAKRISSTLRGLVDY